MCTLVVGYRVHPRYELLVLANRDEFYDRPTARIHAWADAPTVFGGRDLQAGGTWLGLSRTGRFATVTNYRDPHNIRADAPSRGALTADFLTGTATTPAFLAALAPHAAAYNGFNLLVYDGTHLGYLGNYDPDGPRHLPPGVYGLSNALLDSPWPKLRALTAAAEPLWAAEHLPDDTAMIDLLDRPETYPDDQLPHTGVPLERERQLSALRIHIPRPEGATAGGYGTVCSTLVKLGAAGFELHEVNRNPYRTHALAPVRVAAPRQG